MENSKPWYTSKTVLANLLTVATGIAVAVGVLDDDAAQTITAEGPDLLAGLAVSVFGIFGIWGRVVADKKLTG